MADLKVQQTQTMWDHYGGNTYFFLLDGEAGMPGDPGEGGINSPGT